MDLMYELEILFHLLVAGAMLLVALFTHVVIILTCASLLRLLRQLFLKNLYYGFLCQTVQLCKLLGHVALQIPVRLPWRDIKFTPAPVLRFMSFQLPLYCVFFVFLHIFCFLGLLFPLIIFCMRWRRPHFIRAGHACSTVLHALRSCRDKPAPC